MILAFPTESALDAINGESLGMRHHHHHRVEGIKFGFGIFLRGLYVKLLCVFFASPKQTSIYLKIHGCHA